MVVSFEASEIMAQGTPGNDFSFAFRHLTIAEPVSAMCFLACVPKPVLVVYLAYQTLTVTSNSSLSIALSPRVKGRTYLGLLLRCFETRLNNGLTRREITRPHNARGMVSNRFDSDMAQAWG